MTCGAESDATWREILAQPEAVAACLEGRTGHDGLVRLPDLGLSDDEVRSIERVLIVGCGTSLHAGLAARAAVEAWTGLACGVEIASELVSREPVLGVRPLVVGVSQSGETADTLAAGRLSRALGARLVAVTNTPGSTLLREADGALLTRAGPEIGVAATKTHTTQVVALLLLALHLARVRGTLPPAAARSIGEELHRLPGRVATALEGTELVRGTAEGLAAHARDFLFLGRGVAHAVALEGALKLKEVSYARAEGYAAGEMRHGPMALVEPGVVAVAVATRSRAQSRTLSTLAEVRARGAFSVVVATDGDDEAAGHGDAVLTVPDTPELLSAAVDVIPLQLFAYWLARARGRDIDRPRNLAKTVTVE